MSLLTQGVLPGRFYKRRFKGRRIYEWVTRVRYRSSNPRDGGFVWGFSLRPDGTLRETRGLSFAQLERFADPREVKEKANQAYTRLVLAEWGCDGARELEQALFSLAAARDPEAQMEQIAAHYGRDVWTDVGVLSGWFEFKNESLAADLQRERERALVKDRRKAEVTIGHLVQWLEDNVGLESELHFDNEGDVKSQDVLDALAICLPRFKDLPK
jgi:hypothetical protein